MGNYYCKAYTDKRKDDFWLNEDWKLASSIKPVSNPEKLIYDITTDLPSTVVFSLYKAGKIKHPYENDNCLQIQDLDNRIWYYKKEFVINKRADKIILTFEGISYSSKVWLNNIELGSHNGHLGGPIFDVTDKVNLNEKNILYVEVKAATYGMDCLKDLWQRCSDSSVLMPWAELKDNMCGNGCFTPLGIWRGVRLSFLNSVRIERPYLATESIDNNKAHLRLTAEIVDNTFDITQYCMPDSTFNHPFPYFGFAAHGMAIKTDEFSLKLTLKSPKGKIYEYEKKFDKYDTLKAQNVIYENQLIDLEMEIENPDLWFPIGLGKPNLYDCKVELCRNGIVLDEVDFKTGIRIIDVDYTSNPKLNHFTEKYKFIINGKDFFLKGMNWMPTDVLWQFDEDTYNWNINLAKNADIQMLRVWNGGGFIEDDLFYDLCDELGMLVWQDLVLCNTDKPHIVQQELDEQVSLNIYRIRNHASLAVYCGGNELNPDSENNYASMYIEMRDVKYLDPYRYFYPTTPYGGSAHVYRDFESVWFRKQYTFLPFLAESGIHCYPSYASLKKQVDNLPQKASEILEKDFCEKYNGLTVRLVENDLTRIPQMISRASQIIDFNEASLKEFCSASQLANAEYYQIMIEALREKYPVCGGVMPWVFTRPWLSVGVQIVDGLGQPTISYYSIKNTFSNINGIISFKELFFAPNENVSMPVKVINDSGKDINVKVVLDIYNKAFDIVDSREDEIFVGKKDYLKEVFVHNFKLDNSDADSFLFIRLRIFNKNKVVNEKIYLPRCLNKFNNEEFRNLYRNEPQANIRFDESLHLANQIKQFGGKNLLVNIQKINDFEYVARITNVDKNPIFSIDIDSESVFYAEDNYFFLGVNESKTVKLYSKDADCKFTVNGLFID